MEREIKEDEYLLLFAVRKDAPFFTDKKFPIIIEQEESMFNGEFFQEIQKDTDELITLKGELLNKDEYIYPYFQIYYSNHEWYFKLKKGVNRSK